MGTDTFGNGLSYVVLHGNSRIEIPAAVDHTLVEILSRQEREALRSGHIVAVDEQTGAMFNEDSPLFPGSVIRLRPPQPSQDLQDIGIPINRAGELVSVLEATEIKLVELRTQQLFEDMSLAEIRSAVQAELIKMGIPKNQSSAPGVVSPANMPATSSEDRFTTLKKQGKMPYIQAWGEEMRRHPNILLACVA